MTFTFIWGGRITVALPQEIDDTPNEIQQRHHKPKDDQRVDDVKADPKHQLFNWQIGGIGNVR